MECQLSLSRTWATDAATVSRICALHPVFPPQPPAPEAAPAPSAPAPVPPAPPAVTPDPEEHQRLLGQVQATLEALEQSGFTHVQLSRHLKNQGLNVSRTVLRHLQQGKGGALGTPDLRGLLAHLPPLPIIPADEDPCPPVESAALRQAAETLQNQVLLSEIGLDDITGYLAFMLEHQPDDQGDLRVQQAANELLDTLGQDGLLALLTCDVAALDDPALQAQYGPHFAGIHSLGELLTIRNAAHDLSQELGRLANLGWSVEQAAQACVDMGYQGAALSGDAPPSAKQAQAILPYLRRIHQPWQADTPAPAPERERPAPGSLTTHDERVAYIERLIEEQGGVVYTNDLSGPFGMRGSSVSNFLKNAGYHAIGGGGYRHFR